MPILSDPRHERFAQNLASGMTQIEAYEGAGYARSDAQASRLSKNEQVLERVKEILAARENMLGGINAKAAEKAAVSKAWVIEKLKDNLERAMQAEAVLDDDGEAIGTYSYQGSVANRALELIGKELGMFVERKEVGSPGDFAGLEADELERLLRAELAERGVGGTAADAVIGVLKSGRAGQGSTTAH